MDRISSCSLFSVCCVLSLGPLVSLPQTNHQRDRILISAIARKSFLLCFFSSLSFSSSSVHSNTELKQPLIQAHLIRVLKVLWEITTGICPLLKEIMPSTNSFHWSKSFPQFHDVCLVWRFVSSLVSLISTLSYNYVSQEWSVVDILHWQLSHHRIHRPLTQAVHPAASARHDSRNEA
jgi:hypothetical protein